MYFWVLKKTQEITNELLQNYLQNKQPKPTEEEQVRRPNIFKDKTKEVLIGLGIFFFFW